MAPRPNALIAAASLILCTISYAADRQSCMAPISASMLPRLLTQAPFAPASQSEWEIPFKLGAKGIVVQGVAGASTRLKFIIDTGTTISLLDRKVIRRMGFIAHPQESRLVHLDSMTSRKSFLLSNLCLGSIVASLYCLEADLSNCGVDGVIGLDLLRHQLCMTDSKTREVPRSKKLTIDFKRRTIRFESSEHLKYSVPIEKDSPQIVVAARVLGHPLRLVVDTGTSLTTLFRDRDALWMDSILRIVESTEVLTSGGYCHAGKVELPNLELGGCCWGSTPGLVMDARLQPTDGLLSIHTLRLKILHFDFGNNLMSWDR